MTIVPAEADWGSLLVGVFNHMIAVGAIEPADDEEPDSWAVDMPSWRCAAAEYHNDRGGHTAIVDAPHQNMPRAAAAATIDALVFSLRRGVGVLANADSHRRLSELSEEQLRAVCDRLRNFKPEIATPWVPEEVEALTIIWIELKNG
jgi:hypothetical protein